MIKPRVDTFVHPTAIVEEGANIGAGVQVGPYAHIGSHVVLEKGVHVYSHVAITGRTTVGEGTKIYTFAAIGHDPQFIGYAQEPSKITIGKNNLIREHVTIHPGTKKGGMVTSIGDNCMIMVACHIAHDCQVGNSVIMANNATLGGHVTVGDFSIIGGLSGIHQNVRLGQGCIIGGLSGVEGDVIPYGSVMGNRARLCGLNLVGLKRRGVSRQDIHGIRTAYRLLFANEGTLAERMEDVVGLFKKDPYVMQIIKFLQENGTHNLRPLCLPE
jgi:UDP-N-acetylglucosamine acyltransferase